MKTEDAFQFMEENRGKWPLAKMVETLKVSVSGYHKWRARGKTSRQEADRKLLEEMERINGEHRVALGVRPMTALPRKKRNEPINHKRARRVMNQNGMKGLCRKRKTKAKTTDSKHGLPVAENHLNRDFQTKGPKEKMVSDTTYIWTSKGFVYLAAILDLHGRKIVGMAMSENNDKELVLAALKDAKERCGSLKGCLLRSDRGSTYCSKAYREKLEEHECVRSMSRKGNCWDNAPMESFWNTLKLEALDRKISGLEEARHMCRRCRPEPRSRRLRVKGVERIFRGNLIRFSSTFWGTAQNFQFYALKYWKTNKKLSDMASQPKIPQFLCPSQPFVGAMTS